MSAKHTGECIKCGRRIGTYPLSTRSSATPIDHLQFVSLHFHFAPSGYRCPGTTARYESVAGVAI